MTPTASQRMAFLKAAATLKKLGEEGLHLYLAEDTLHLLSGPSHDRGGRDNIPRQDRSVESVYIPGAGGGAW